jgi:subtilisin family serine protease
MERRRPDARRVWLTRRLILAVLAACAAAWSSGSALAVADPVAAERGYRQTVAMPVALPPLHEVKVGIVDTGVDGEHPDLAGRIVAARGFGGLDPLYPNADHGTMVAGLIAAVPDNGVGIDGLSPTARLVVASVSRPGSAVYSDSSVAAAIRWTVDQGARVVNLSLSGASDDAIDGAVRYAIRKGAVVVAAAGNCFPDCGRGAPAQFPAPDWHVLGVGALDDDAATPAVAAFSVRNPDAVDIVAPGERITTLYPTRNSQYAIPKGCPYVGTTACWHADSTRLWGATGTSFSTPIVAAAASLLFAARPELTASQVVDLLEQTARPLPGDTLRESGFGVLQIDAALARALHGPLPTSDVGEPNDPGSEPYPLALGRGLTATLNWWDDRVDSYTVHLPEAARRVRLHTSGSIGARFDVVSEPGGRSLAHGWIGTALTFPARPNERVRIRIDAARHATGAYSLEFELR